MDLKLKRGICAASLLLFLGLVWLMAVDGFSASEDMPVETARREKKEVPLERRDHLVAEILESFNPYVWDVKKVNWGTEELVSRMWERLEQCREGDVGRPTWWIDSWEIVLAIWRRSERKADSPQSATGYIQLFPKPQGSLKGYAVMALGWWQYTWLITDRGIYQIYSTAGTRSWRESMEELLQSVPQWRLGEEEARRYVHDFKTDKNAFYGPFLDIDRLSVWYDGMNFLFTEHRLLDTPKDVTAGNGMSLRFWDAKNQEQEMQINPVEMPVFAGYEKWREYLLTRHPDMTGCYFRTREAGQYCDDPFIMLETEETQWGYFLWEGRWYQIRFDIPGSGDPFDMELRRTGGKLGYESMPTYWWREDEKGNTMEADLTRDEYVLVEEIGPGQVFSFTCEMVGTRENGIWDEKVYRVAVTALGAEEPFQVFEAGSARGDEFSYWDYDNAFYFVDFNSDGYQDLQMLYYYGANGGSVSTFIWSPSREEFVRVPEELDNEDYRCYPETRRLNMHHRNGGSSGTDELYQWTGEMDYELLRCRDYTYEDVFDADDPLIWTGENYHCRIVSFEGGRERVLADYTYDSDEEMSGYVSLLYWLDVAWERQVDLEGTASCTLRYLQDVSEEEGETAYLDYLLISRADTCLVGALSQEAPSAYEDFVWDEENSRLTVSYQDGTIQCYQWNGTAFAVDGQREMVDKFSD